MCIFHDLATASSTVSKPFAYLALLICRVELPQSLLLQIGGFLIVCWVVPLRPSPSTALPNVSYERDFASRCQTSSQSPLLHMMVQLRLPFRECCIGQVCMGVGGTMAFLSDLSHLFWGILHSRGWVEGLQCFPTAVQGLLVSFHYPLAPAEQSLTLW